MTFRPRLQGSKKSPEDGTCRLYRNVAEDLHLTCCVTTHACKRPVPMRVFRPVTLADKSMYRFIRNGCRCFNNLSYTFHLICQYVVAPMDQEIQSFLLWCAVCSSYAFLRLERSSLRWRRTAVRRRFVCLHFVNVGQLQLSSGNSAPNSVKNHHLTIPFEDGMHSFKRQGVCV